MQETQVRSLGQEDSPGEGNGNPLQYSCLGNPMDRGAWQATFHRLAKSQTWLKRVSTIMYTVIPKLFFITNYMNAYHTDTTRPISTTTDHRVTVSSNGTRSLYFLKSCPSRNCSLDKNDRTGWPLWFALRIQDKQWKKTKCSQKAL